MAKNSKKVNRNNKYKIQIKKKTSISTNHCSYNSYTRMIRVSTPVFKKKYCEDIVWQNKSPTYVSKANKAREVARGTTELIFFKNLPQKNHL